MTQDRRDTVARAIYTTHWKAPDPETGRAGAPVWENVSAAVREWVLAQADSAIAALNAANPGAER